VTKGIAERTGWGRFEDSRRVLVTLADTPGKTHPYDFFFVFLVANGILIYSFKKKKSTPA
jgi:hypothetical protein